jgi:hypothetical protein
VLTSDDTRKLFAPPSRAMKCRQMVWKKSCEAGGPVAIADLCATIPSFEALRSTRRHGFGHPWHPDP